MQKNRTIALSLMLLLMVSCILFTPSTNKTTGTPESKAGGNADVTPTAGSVDFSAQATSPQSVLLTWKAVDGATGYNLEFGWNGKDFHPLMELSSDR